MMDDDNGFGRNVLPEKHSDNSSCLVGNPAIGFTILEGRGITTGLPVSWQPLKATSSTVSTIESAQLGYDKSAMSILE